MLSRISLRIFFNLTGSDLILENLWLGRNELETKRRIDRCRNLSEGSKANCLHKVQILPSLHHNADAHVLGFCYSWTLLLVKFLCVLAIAVWKTIPNFSGFKQQWPFFLMTVQLLGSPWQCFCPSDAGWGCEHRDAQMDGWHIPDGSLTQLHLRRDTWQLRLSFHVVSETLTHHMHSLKTTPGE